MLHHVRVGRERHGRKLREVAKHPLEERGEVALRYGRAVVVAPAARLRRHRRHASVVAGAWKAKGSSMRDFGQAPERRSGLSLAPRRRGLSFRACAGGAQAGGHLQLRMAAWAAASQGTSPCCEAEAAHARACDAHLGRRRRAGAAAPAGAALVPRGAHLVPILALAIGRRLRPARRTGSCWWATSWRCVEGVWNEVVGVRDGWCGAGRGERPARRGAARRHRCRRSSGHEDREDDERAEQQHDERRHQQRAAPALAARRPLGLGLALPAHH